MLKLKLKLKLKLVVRFLLYSALLVLGPLFASHHSFAACHQTQQRTSPKILYFVPDTSNQIFWDIHVEFMQAVAADLGIRLEIQVIKAIDHNRFDFGRQVVKQVKKQNPDYVIGPLFQDGGKALLNTIEKLGIPFLSLNSSISAANLALLGLPRQNYRHWIGHIAPNDFIAGYDLAQALTPQVGADKPSTMLAIAGSTHSPVSQNREAGLMAAINRQSTILLPIIHTDWRKPDANTVMHAVLKRTLPIERIWTIGADTAAGVVDALLSRQIIPGKEIKIGTMDWSPVALELIKNGYVEISYGGHFMESGWALVLLYDYDNKIDFADELGVNITTLLRPLTKNNLALFSDTILKQSWEEFDFTLLSKCFNPQRKNYDLNINVLKTIRVRP